MIRSRPFVVTAKEARDGGCSRVPLFVAALVILAVFWALRGMGTWPEARGEVQLALGIASLAWIFAVRVARRVPDTPGTGLFVVVVALGLRFLALGAVPALSDDVYRYVFEGGLVAEGQSPYVEAPADPGRKRERELWPEVYSLVNHPEVSAAYPPLTEYVFGAVVSAAGGPEAKGGERAVRFFRVFFATCDLLVLGLLWRLFAKRRIPKAGLCLWAWSPLVVIEFAGSAHFDALGILLFVAALVVFETGESGNARSEAVAFVLLALGCAVKFLPVVALPFLLRHGERPVRGLLIFVATLLSTLAGLFVLEGGVGGLTRGLGVYALRWESFNILFPVVEAPFGALFARDGGWFDARRLARLAIGAIFLVRVAYLWRRNERPFEAARGLIALFLVLTPTLHPWYLTWILPLLVLQPSVAWILFLGAAPLLYWPLTEWRAIGEWREPGWLWFALGAPFLMVWMVEEWWRRDFVRKVPK
ncbi:MAG: hypothetical protein CMJ89_11000 [Planctomycetes bacterium]|nr:hypothetical protein [Planctomycetota bacterium]